MNSGISFNVLKKILENTKDLAFTDLIRALLKDRRFYVVLKNKQSRWRRQRNGLPHGSVLAPLLYNTYINDQSMDQNTEQFIYADNLCVTSQESTFEAIEANLTSALDELHLCYECNHLHTNPAKRPKSARSISGTGKQTDPLTSHGLEHLLSTVPALSTLL